jgi:hypothetical protein
VSLDQTDVRAAAGDAALEKIRGPAISAAMAGASGRWLRVEGVLRPVIALAEGAMRGRAACYAVSETRPDGREIPALTAAMNAVDLARIDLAVIDRTFVTLEPSTAERPPLLILPLSWSSLRNARTRQRLLRLAAAGQLKLRTIALCEVTGIEPGTPQAALREVTGRLQPIFRGVLAHVTPERRTIRSLADCGFTGATVEAADLDEAEDEGAMLRTVLALQKIGPGVLVHAVRSVAGLTAARAAGASWASLEIVPGALGASGLAAHAKTAAGETPTAASETSN